MRDPETGLPAACPSRGTGGTWDQELVTLCWRRTPTSRRCGDEVGDNSVGLCDKHLEKLRSL